LVNYIVGVGSQRAGSTLLYRILDECSSVFMHPVKELHYYDTLFNVRDEKVLKIFSKRQLDNFTGDISNSKKDHCFFRTNNILYKNSVANISYHDLYRPCIMGNEYLCEITPEYMILPIEGIAKMYEDLGPDTKIILIARNPVQRFISAVKLLKLYGGKPFNMAFFEEELLRVLDEMPHWVNVQDSLNDYEACLNKYNKYFSKVLFLSYDQIVNSVEETHEALEAFLDVSVDKGRYNELLNNKVNSLAKTGIISEKTQSILRKRYQRETQYLAECFGVGACVM